MCLSDAFETKFDKQDLVDFTFNREALLWLKLKSISKKEPQNDFLQFSGISPQTTGVKKIWCELFDTMKNDIEGSIRLLDDFSEIAYAEAHNVPLKINREAESCSFQPGFSALFHRSGRSLHNAG